MTPTRLRLASAAVMAALSATSFLPTPASAQIEGATVQPAAYSAGSPVYHRRHRRVRGEARMSTPITGGRYFIEFRSRYALSYGHTYAAFGRLNAAGQIVQMEVAGLHPAGDSSVPWMLGHLVPVVSETGPSDGDLEEKYVSNRYRVTMGEADYNKLVAKIHEMQRTTPLWSATMYNCNAFVGDIARFMGLKAPPAPSATLQVPPQYIAHLKSINNGQSSIAPGSI